MTKDEATSTERALNLALEAYMAAGFGNSTDFALQQKAYDLAVKALAKQPAPAAELREQEPVAVVSGYYGGQCVILPIDPAQIFNSNTALYTSPQPAQQRHISYACPQCHWSLEEQPAQQQEPVAWRELCRRLYMELYWCDRQMMETLDQDGEPMWTQGKEVRDVLADAKAALDTSPPASKPWVGLTDEDIKEAEWLLSAIKEHEAYTLQEQLLVEGVDVFARAIEAKLKEKNSD